MSRIKMRTVLITIFSLVLWVGITGCSHKVEQIPEVTQEPEPQPVEEPVVQPEQPSEPEIVEPEPVEIVLDMIHFDFDRYNLKPEAIDVLEKNAQILKEHPEVTITIEGHCDERGTVDYNLALGEKRANAAKKYLVEAGINPSRIKVVSYGKEKPLMPGHNEAAWAMNRRDEFIVN